MLTNFKFENVSGLVSRRPMIKKMEKLISMHRFFIFLLLNFIVTASYGYSQTTEDVLILDNLISIAIENNPQLRSFYRAVQVDSAKIPQSGALPDPILSLNILNLPTNSFSFDQEPMTGKQIALSQLFPFPGKLGLQEDISSEGAAVSSANYQEYRNQIIRDLKIGFYDLFILDKSIEITNKNQQLLKEFAEIAEAKYKVGKGLQQDVLKAQVEVSKMIERLIQLKQKREVKQAEINTILNQPVDTQLGKPEDPGFTMLDKTLDTLQIMAQFNRPLLMGWESLKKQSNLKVDLAKKDYWPNFGVFLAYTQRDELQNGSSGYDFVSGGISLNLPIYSGSKQSKKVEETIYNKSMIEERYKQVVNQVYFELENKLTSIEKNAKLVELFKTGIIPQASQSLESAMTGYQTDKVDFLTLINNQITLFNYELEYYRVISDYNKDLASLEYIAGIQVTSSNLK
jgi:cobalt-zinc-cadmium efflux system outer membrane protein